MAPKPEMARVVVVVFGAGLAAGMILGALVVPDAPVGGALAGLLSVVPLIPACWRVTAAQRGRGLSVIARLEGARATKSEGRQLEAGHERLTRRVPHVA